MINMLIVEDDETLLDALKMCMAEEGYNIDATNNGANALRYISKRMYDVVISDMNLGDTNGINILKASRNMNRDVKFIMITGYSSVETAVEAIRCGIYDYIIKPFDTTELKFRVRQAIDKLEADRQNLQIEERYNIIMDNIPFGIAIISPEMEVLEVNKQILTWFPEVKTSETPACFSVFCSPSQATICQECPVEKTLKDGKQHSKLRHVSCDGQNRKLKCSTNPVFDESHQIISVLTVMQEV